MEQKEEIAFKVTVDNNEGAKSLKDLKKDFSELQSKLSETKEGTDEYYKTLKKLGAVKDDIGDLRSQINALNPEGKVQAFANLGSKITAGFGAATGAAALFGTQSEEVEKTLLKVQSALALSQGIKEVVGLGDAFKEVGIILKTNPILLIGTVIIGIGAALFALKDKIKPIGEAFDFVGRIINEYIIQPVKEFLDLIGLTNSEVDAMGEAYKAAADKATAALTAQTEAFDRQIKVAGAAGKSTIELEKAKQQAIINTNKALVEQLIAFVRAGGELDEERKKLLTEQLKAITNATTEIKVLDINAKKEALEKQKKHNEDLKKLYEEDIKNSQEAYAYQQKQSEFLLNEQKEFKLSVEKDLASETLNIQTEMAKTAISEVQTNEAEITAIKKAENLIRIKEDAAALAKNLETTKQGLQSVQNLSDLFFTLKSNKLKKGSQEELEAAKKQFEINKALQMATAVVNGAQAVTAILSVPDFTLGIASAARIVSAGLATIATVAKISSTKFEGGASGGSASVGGGLNSIPIPPPPSIQNTNNTVTGLDSNGTVIKNNNQKESNIVVKAVVLETEMTEVQENALKLKKQSTF